MSLTETQGSAETQGDQLTLIEASKIVFLDPQKLQSRLIYSLIPPRMEA